MKKSTFRYLPGSELHEKLLLIMEKCKFPSFQETFEQLISQGYKDVLNNVNLLAKVNKLEQENEKLRNIIKSGNDLKNLFKN